MLLGKKSPLCPSRCDGRERHNLLATSYVRHSTVSPVHLIKGSVVDAVYRTRVLGKQQLMNRMATGFPSMMVELFLNYLSSHTRLDTKVSRIHFCPRMP